MSAVVQESTRQ